MSKDLDTSIHQPHDGLFKQAFHYKEVAYDFLSHRLSDEVLQAVDLATLELQGGSFVSKEFKRTESDMVYAVKTKHGEGYVYLLLEHQTEEDHTMPLRLMRYNLHLMEQHVAQHGGKLPAIFNVVLYAGRKSYLGPRTLEGAFEAPQQAHDMLHYTFLVALHEEEDEALFHDGKAALVELLLKQAQDRDACKFLDTYGEEVVGLINSSPYGDPACDYLMDREVHAPEQLLAKLRNLTPKRKEHIMSALEIMKARGVQQGMHTRELDIARKLRDKGMDAHTIKEVTGVDSKDLESKK